MNSDKSLLIRKLNKSFTATDQGTPFYLPGKENGPQPDTKLLLSALIKA